MLCHSRLLTTPIVPQGEQEHRRVKRFYARTNKNEAARQIARRQRREQLLNRLLQIDRQRRATFATVTAPSCVQPRASRNAPSVTLARPHNGTLRLPTRRGATLALSEDDPLPFHTSPREHYHMSESKRYYENIYSWLGSPENKHNKALRVRSLFVFTVSGLLTTSQNFIPSLKDHLLSRLMGREYEGDEDTFGMDEHTMIDFVHDRIYFHKALHINYTTYDMRRAQDSINMRRQADIMILAPHEDDGDVQANAHPYWYARVLGIFHVNVRHRGLLSRSKHPQRMDVLWVRWFGRDLTAPGGFKAQRLHRVGFIDWEQSNSFGFLDPAQVLRASHLVPAFAHGKTDEYLPPSIARQHDEKDLDYVYYYVGM